MRLRALVLTVFLALIPIGLAVPSAQAATAAPNAPTNLTIRVDAMIPDRFQLSWSDNTPVADLNNETDFEVQRCAGVACVDFATLIVWPTSGFQLLGYTDASNNRAENTTYTYRVRGVNAVGASEWSNTAAATTGWRQPASPSALTATYVGFNTRGLNGNTSLAWLDNANNEVAYRVTRCATLACSTTQVSYPLPANATSYVDTTVVDGEEYYYWVSAIGGSGLTSSSDVALHSAGNGLAAPTNLTATLTSTGIALRWRNQVTTQPIEVWRCDTNVCRDARTLQWNLNAPWVTKAIRPAGSTRYTDTFTKAAQTRYSYRIRVTSANAVSAPVYVSLTTP
jgi:hypothetical protein